MDRFRLSTLDLCVRLRADVNNLHKFNVIRFTNHVPEAGTLKQLTHTCRTWFLLVGLQLAGPLN